MLWTVFRASLQHMLVWEGIVSGPLNRAVRRPGQPPKGCGASGSCSNADERERVKRPRLRSDLCSPLSSAICPNALKQSTLSFRIRELQGRQRREKMGAGSGADAQAPSVYTDTNSSPGASFRRHDSVPRGSSLLFLFLLHTMKCAFDITTLPGRAAFERRFLGNLQLPKMMHRAPQEGTVWRTVSSKASTHTVSCCWPQLYATETWR